MPTKTPVRVTEEASRASAHSPAPASESSKNYANGHEMNDYGIYLFRSGAHTRLYESMGAHIGVHEGRAGVQFRVWAPNAARVSLVGDFNGWSPAATEMSPRWDSSGIWECFVEGLEHGALYKYHIVSRSSDGYEVQKSDPFAFSCEPPPRTGSRVWSLDYDWGDQAWMAGRGRANALDAPHAAYEVHLGSWRRDPSDPSRLLSYRELAEPLAEYVREMGYTHVELMPVTEHPFYGSWGYQTTGYFAPTARYGTPQDFMHFVDHLHRCGIGVILDWVPSHFPSDQHGLAYFDGTHLYEHADPRQGFHPEWSSCIFNYERHEVRSFLLSSALFWLDRYHIDGLRVDAVASMLYLDYARKEGEWVPNAHGGKENLGAVSFLRSLSEAVYRDFPDTQTIAEESTAWPAVSRPVYTGGLGFGMKWNMGWMHDSLAYFSHDPIHRRYHHQQLTFSAWYAFTENFVLPLSHDEVVHGKGSLLHKMPGDDWQSFANLRCLLGYMWAHPGKKLLFMGCDFGQRSEWRHDDSLEWHVLGFHLHQGVQAWVRDLNRYYRTQPALFERDFENTGFEWADHSDAQNSVLAFVRKARSGPGMVLALCNLTPVARLGYRIGVPRGGWWREALNSDAAEYGGSGMGNMGGTHAVPEPSHGRPCSLVLTLPPLSTVLLESTG
jgi:1,4-alpha-glucan branching enzyme